MIFQIAKTIVICVAAGYLWYLYFKVRKYENTENPPKKSNSRPDA